MRLILSLAALAALSTPLVGCSSACNQQGAPQLTVRSPVLFDREPASLAGERIRMMPAQVIYAAPQYVPAQPESRAFNPCDPNAASRGLPSASPSYTPIVPGR